MNIFEPKNDAIFRSKDSDTLSKVEGLNAYYVMNPKGKRIL